VTRSRLGLVATLLVALLAAPLPAGGQAPGRNIAIVHRSSGGQYERLPDLAADMVRRGVDVIVAPATQNVQAAKQATGTIPIVMAGSGDPVRDGLVASLARPGGNVTGLAMLGTEVTAKQLELLRDIAPGMSRVGVLGNPTNQAYPRWLEGVKTAVRSLGAQLQIVEVRAPDDLERAFETMTRKRAGALFVFADGMLILHRTRVVELAARHRLPAMYAVREFVDAGGLVVYGPSMRDSFRRAATYVDRILKGARPADLPVEQPTTFELIVNLKAARALGLTIPPPVLTRADEVLQ
jgi:putative ABC transport system substrate-binding protein